MSAKNVDRHNRFRSITVGFRVSPEEQEELNRAVALSGLPKQEYCYRKCMGREVVVQPNPRVHKALKTQMTAIRAELERIAAGGSVPDELLSTIDERQSVQNTISSISALDTEINHPDENSPENFEDIMRQMQRMSDPAYLHTVSMNELYETVYQSRPPVIDGLLYSGTYLFAGAPKVGKSFFMAQLA